MPLSDAALEKKVQNWLAWDKNEKTLLEIKTLYENKNEEELKKRMNSRLLFGTAGIRAPMEGGFGRLSDLTIIQVTHGFALHVLNQFPGQGIRGIAIGYDGRYNSKRFAELAASVFLHNSISVYLFSKVVATPLVSWATIYYKCLGGLMVTASHNPKEDNGYKAYWSNGAQIITPNDDEIIRLAEENPQPRDEYWDTSILSNSSLFHSADPCLQEYYKSEVQYCYHKDINVSSPLKFTYSAFHGVGYEYSKEMLALFGVPPSNFFSVKEQERPDPEFPTVPFPNPEEGLKVLKLSIKTADESGSTVILANDPDADRLQMAEKQQDGTWKVFSGNEMGTLLAWWVWKHWQERNPGKDKKNVVFINSAVSSQFVRTMAQVEGFSYAVTLTGFKWMGNKSEELRGQGKEVALAWEESIGFMPGHALDKDGVLGAAMFAEMANWLNNHKLSLNLQLYALYKQYGFHLVRSTYWIVPSPTVTKALFDSLRKDLKYPQKIGNDAVKYVRDLTIGYDNAEKDNKPVLPLSLTSEMITFQLENGSLATLRASGTEPKLKYYIELKTAPGKDASDLSSVLQELDELEKNVVQILLRPQEFGLLPRK